MRTRLTAQPRMAFVQQGVTFIESSVGEGIGRSYGAPERAEQGVHGICITTQQGRLCRAGS